MLALYFCDSMVVAGSVLEPTHLLFRFLLFFLVWLVIAALTTIALDFFQSFFFFTKLYHFVKTSSSYTSFSINEAILHLDIMSERIQTKYF